MEVLFIKEMIFAFLQHITFILKHEALLKYCGHAYSRLPRQWRTCQNCS